MHPQILLWCLINGKFHHFIDARYVGQVIAAGTQVATLEAMKMNTFIYAEKAGTVAALLVTPGAGVEEGAPLIRLG